MCYGWSFVVNTKSGHSFLISVGVVFQSYFCSENEQSFHSMMAWIRKAMSVEDDIGNIPSVYGKTGSSTSSTLEDSPEFLQRLFNAKGSPPGALKFPHEGGHVFFIRMRFDWLMRKNKFQEPFRISIPSFLYSVPRCHKISIRLALALGFLWNNWSIDWWN